MSDLSKLSDPSSLGLKPILASRTVWSSLVGMGCFLASILGVQTEFIDQGALAEALLQAATALGFVGSIVFRVIASARLTP